MHVQLCSEFTALVHVHHGITASHVKMNPEVQVWIVQRALCVVMVIR